MIFKLISIKNCPYHFFSDMINIKNFDLNFLSTNKISFINTDAVTYYINFIQDRGRGGQKGPFTSFSIVTSTNVGISPQNFLTFSFATLV